MKARVADFRMKIVADLRKRAQTFADSIPKQTSKKAKAACYVAASALDKAANDYENGDAP